MRRLRSVLIVLAVSSPLAVADTWWYTYEADGTFPEQEGWARNVMGGGAQRWFEDGAFVLDASASPGIVDFYAKGMPSLPDPNDPMQAFVCEWRLRVDAMTGYWDPTFFLLFEGHGDILLGYEMGQIYSLHEHQYIAAFQPSVFHSYRIVTNDMTTYTFALDGVVVYTGEVSVWAPSSVVQFGDTNTGSGAVSRWDYVRYGVIAVPEPGSLLLCVTAVLRIGMRLRRRTQ